MSFELFVGKRYLRTNQDQIFLSMITLLSVLGVALGVMVLVVVIAVMTGFETELTKRILGIEAHVLVMRYGEPLTDYAELIPRIEAEPGVTSAAPFIYTQAMMRSPKGMTGVVLRGLDPASMGCRLRTVEGQCLGETLFPQPAPAGGVPVGGVPVGDEADGSISLPEVVLGSALAEKYGLKAGDLVHLLSAQGDGEAMGRLPAVQPVRVVGLFETGMHEYDAAVVFMDLAGAQGLLGMQGQATGVEVRLADVYQAKAMAATLAEQLDYPYWTRDWIQMNRNLFSMLTLQKAVMFIILILIVLVAAFNIASALIMMVMEKTRDIAILKTMGATNASIRKIFVFKGLLIGFIGVFMGVAGGVGLSLLLQRYQFIHLPGDVYFLTTLPVHLNILDIGIIIGATLLICLLATLYPARQAARYKPVEGIRYH
jgi:lipoprotein-releasing system permease protein